MRMDHVNLRSFRVACDTRVCIVGTTCRRAHVRQKPLHLLQFPSLCLDGSLGIESLARPRYRRRFSPSICRWLCQIQTTRLLRCSLLRCRFLPIPSHHDPCWCFLSFPTCISRLIVHVSSGSTLLRPTNCAEDRKTNFRVCAIPIFSYRSEVKRIQKHNRHICNRRLELKPFIYRPLQTKYNR